MNHRSLAFRLTVWYTLLLTAIFALVGTGMYLGLQHYLHAGLRDSLRRRSTQVQQILSRTRAGVSNAEIARSINTRVAPEFNDRFVRVTRVPGTLVYQSGMPADHSFDPRAVPVVAGARSAGHDLDRAVIAQKQRLMVRVVSMDTDSGRYLIEFGASLGAMDALQARLLILLALLLPALVVCAAGGGYLLVHWALRPVDRMSQTAEHMSMQNLEAQLPVLSTGDALQRLSSSFNHLLMRLRDSVLTARRFQADASHELRTPLTVIKGMLQETVTNGTIQDDVRERIGSVLEEVGRLEQLVSGLLALSRLEAGQLQREWLEVDLAELAAGTCEQMRLMAEDRGIQIRSSELQRTVVCGDRGRIKQVIVNLLDNAIRFTPCGGTITLLTRRDDCSSTLEVRDTGVGIPPEAVPHVFDRFFRVDEARTRADGGAGLGLSIAKTICLAHGAQLSVESQLGSGSCFRLTFPKSRGLGGGGAQPRPAQPKQTGKRRLVEVVRGSRGPRIPSA